MSTHTYGESRFAQTPDGRRLHLMVRGDGPVVAFVSGLGMSRSSWGHVVPRLAERATTVVYDRAGTGRSDEDPQPAVLDRLVDDLLVVLASVGPGPYVLVGHSWGGPIARVAAARLGPDRVRGVVCVDQADERCPLYFDPRAEKRFAWAGRFTKIAFRTPGYARLLSRLDRGQPADVHADYRADDLAPRTAIAMEREMAGFLPGLAALREHPPELGGIPVTVMTGTRPTRLDRKIRAAINQAHRETAAALPGGRLVEAPKSAHMIVFDEPELIVAEVRRLLDGAEGGTTDG